jgi:[citrate (pro-3S)-lyase] ligase
MNPAVNGVTYVPEGVSYVHMHTMFERPHTWGENLFFDTGHLNEYGQSAVAKVLFECLKARNFFDDLAVTSPAPIHKKILLPDQSLPDQERTALESYMTAIAPLRLKIGAIVMTCNPFTLGHHYLIEQSAKKVRQLFIFVVEENRFSFTFADRVELVRQGTRDIPNVTVIPGGKFIISSLTFVDYFGKSEMQDRVIDPSMDVKLFAQYIAPKMGITIRFAGEEPLDSVTRQYNDAMRLILPQYDIGFETIPRLESGGEVISASLVRTLLELQDFKAIAKLVPVTTLRYLKKRFRTQNPLGLSKSQELVFRLITPMVKRLADVSNFQRFRRNPAEFFNSLKSRKYRLFGKIFFPLSSKMKM